METTPPPHSPSESTIVVSRAREEGGERSKKARRTFLTQNACTRCRQKKSKCDGVRPVCGRCQKNSADCAYDVAQEGVTRMQNLQQLLEKKTDDHDRVMTLFNAFQCGSDDLATNLLARLRLGESIQTLVADIEESQYSSVGDGVQFDSTDTQDLDQPRQMQSWATTPVNQSAFATWGERSDPSDNRTVSHFSASRLDPSRAATTYGRADLIPPDQQRRAHVDEGSGYYSSAQSGANFPEPGPYFGSAQHPSSADVDSSTVSRSEESFLDDSTQSSSRSQQDTQSVLSKPGKKPSGRR